MVREFLVLGTRDDWHIRSIIDGMSLLFPEVRVILADFKSGSVEAHFDER